MVIFKLSKRSLFYFMLLLLIVPIAYCININNFGIYGDSWADLGAFQQGFSVSQKYLNSDKPLTTWLWYGLFKIFGYNYLLWNFYTIIIKILISIVCFALSAVFFESITHRTFFALLALLYPGFSQMPLSQLYGMNLTVLLFSLTSIYFLFLYIDNLKLPFLLLSLMLSALSYTSLDYFIGLELSKIILILFFVDKLTVNKKLRLYAPFFILSVSYIIWRAFIFKSTRPIADQKKIIQDFLNNPIAEIFNRIHIVVSDFLEAFIIAWNQTLSINIFDTDSKSNVISLFVIFIVFALVWVIISKQFKAFDSEAKESESKAGKLIFYGIIIFITSMLPMWFAGRDINLIGHLEIGTVETMDRYTLPSILGICMTFTGLFLMFIPNIQKSIILFSFLVGLATSFHFRNGFIYKYYWNDLNTFLTQFTNRVPNLAPNTTIFLFGNNQIYPRHSYNIGFPINHLYSKEIDNNLKFWVYNLTSRYNSMEFRNLDSSVIHDTCRTFIYRGDPNRKIFVFYNTGSSLRIIDSTNIEQFPFLNNMVKNYIHFANNSECILREPKVLFNESLFRLSKSKDWSYFFEKAEFERQMGNNDAVVEISKEVLNLKLVPPNGIETVTFIDALLKNNQMKLAFEFYKMGMNEKTNLFYSQMVLNKYSEIFSGFKY